MSQPTKEVQPPSYDEDMFGYTEAPQVIFNYSKLNDPIHGNPSAPPHPPNATFQQVPSYEAFETTPVNVIQPPNVVPKEIIIIDGCPACRIRTLEDSHPCIGLLCALVFFLCCLAMKNKRCSNCGTKF